MTSELLPLLERLGLADHAALLAPYATLELGLVPDPAADLAILGGSRIGGDPDLPPELPWPCRRWPLAEVTTWPDYAQAEVEGARTAGQAWTDGDELVMPIPFVLQLDLAAIADPRLPDHGVLAFFASVTSDIPDPRYSKRVAAAVIHIADRSTLARRAHPPTFDAPACVAVALRAEPAVHWDVPYEELPRVQAAMSPAQFDALVADTRRVTHAVFATPDNESAGPMPPPGEVALLRVHDDFAAGFAVGDASWITFCIPEVALREHRFAEARASVYCG